MISKPRALVIIASDQPGSPDPAWNWSAGGAAYLPQIYETLFRFTGESELTLEPLLADGIPSRENGGISENGLVYTVTIKSNASFHDGSPVDADAVIYSYQRIAALNKGPNGISADWIERIEKADAKTVRFILKRPFSDFLMSLGSAWGNFIVNPKVLRQHEVDGDWGHQWSLDYDSGSGPYILARFDHAINEITLERYENYWGGWPNKDPVNRVLIRWLINQNNIPFLLEKKVADIVINMPSDDFPITEKSPDFTVHKFPGMMQYYLGFNAQAVPLDNKKIRQALQYTFDRDQIIQQVFKGSVSPITGTVALSYQDSHVDFEYPKFDLEKASQLIKEAGYPDGFEIRVNRLGFWADDREVLEYWQRDLRRIQIKLVIVEPDPTRWVEAWFNQCSAPTDPELGQVSTMQVGGDYPSALELISQVWTTPRLGGGMCSAVYINNPKINDNAARLAGEDNLDIRYSLFKELYAEIHKDAGAIIIGQVGDEIIIRNQIKGYEYSFALGGNYVPLYKMSIKD